MAAADFARRTRLRNSRPVAEGVLAAGFASEGDDFVVAVVSGMASAPE